MYLEGLYGKYQKNLLEVFFKNPTNSYSVRELARQGNVDSTCLKPSARSTNKHIVPKLKERFAQTLITKKPAQKGLKIKVKKILKNSKYLDKNVKSLVSNVDKILCTTISGRMVYNTKTKRDK